MSAFPNPATGFYGWGMRRRRTANLARRVLAHAPCPILSIGNLTAGGTGKTPAVIWLASYLRDQGHRVTVVSRGHGGAASAEGAIVSMGAGPLLSPAQGGDEPVLLSRRLQGVPVVIGRDRAAAARRAVDECGAEMVVLDDGFQFWSLPRLLDLVLLDARAPFGNGQLLPIGRLREEPAALARAGAILLTRADLASPEKLSTAKTEVARFTDAPQFTCCHRPLDVWNERTGAISSLDFLRSRRVILVSALAGNDAFRGSIEKLGAQVVAHVARRDHHPWQAKDFRRLPLGAEFVLTTEKDAVKLSPAWFTLPLLSLRIELDLGENATRLQAMIDCTLADAIS